MYTGKGGEEFLCTPGRGASAILGGVVFMHIGVPFCLVEVLFVPLQSPVEWACRWGAARCGGNNTHTVHVQ